MKLNLGGGKLEIEGFINVDLCEESKMKHDLREPLPVEDNSVDEMMAIHVIESFYRFMFLDIIKDWYRALKPGGKLTIEFTELSETIKMYQEDNEEVSKYGKWGMYGNQNEPKDPITYHHYVWERDELDKVLKDAGFKTTYTKENIRHHERRDWRVICEK